MTEDRFLKDHSSIILRLKKATRAAVDSKFSLQIPKLDHKSLRIISFANYFFAKNYDVSTELAHVCFLTDKDGSSAPMDFKSYRSKRIVMSAMGGGVIALSDLFDCAATYAEEIGGIYGGNFPD